ncbi:zinc-binding dehydrogenase [Rhodococcus cerastii]|nr:zinc-binding dehydrogenase [Rhodococcus cerastii]
MRAVVITKHGGTEVLKVQEHPRPALAPDGVRIEVRAAGVNFADIMARLGLYEDAPPVPCVVGYEISGIVIEIGSEVSELALGDRVVAGTRFGGYAEEVCVNQHDVFILPKTMSFPEGAAIPVNYATAWAGLVGYGNLRAGERILVNAAAGGVGIAATQLAKHIGAEVYGTASLRKHDAICGFGVDVALDYTRSGWAQDLPPFDLIMDAVGGASFKRSYDLLRPGGRLIAFGASSVVSGDERNLLKAAPQALRMIRGFNLMKQMSESKVVVGLNMLRLWEDRASLAPWINPLMPLLASGVVAPVISDVISFSDAAQAHRILTERRNIGKVVLVP